MKNGNSKKIDIIQPDFSAIYEMFPNGFIPRTEIGRATGGLLNPKYMANMDSNPDVEGIKGRFKVKRKICYPVKSVVEFLEKRAQIIDPA